MSPAKLLRDRIATGKVLTVPGGGSPLEIKLIENTGFEAAYISGYATAASRFGIPDIGLMGYAEIESMVLSTRHVTSLPVIIDCDTGYGDIANVVRTVRGMENLGVAGIQIEDQLWPKRCGHMENKQVESREIAVRKVDAAVNARRNPDTLIIARTDSRGAHDLDEALERCRLFKQAGADVLFVDGPQSIDELKRIGSELSGPLVANMSESGLTPILSSDELHAIGFSIVLFPSSTIRLTVQSVSDFLSELIRTGDSRSWINRMASLSSTNEALGLTKIKNFDQKILERR